jgi:hypothetical protein
VSTPQARAVREGRNRCRAGERPQPHVAGRGRVGSGCCRGGSGGPRELLADCRRRLGVTPQLNALASVAAQLAHGRRPARAALGDRVHGAHRVDRVDHPDDGHRQHRDQLEGHPELERRGYRDHRPVPDAGRVEQAQRDGHQVADDHRDEHRHGAQQPSAELVEHHGEHQHQHEAGDREGDRCAEVRRAHAAGGEVDAAGQQPQADDQDDRPGHHRRERRGDAVDAQRDRHLGGGGDQHAAEDGVEPVVGGTTTVSRLAVTRVSPCLGALRRVHTQVFGSPASRRSVAPAGRWPGCASRRAST